MRKWKGDVPLKGVTLTRMEAEKLVSALSEDLRREPTIKPTNDEINIEEYSQNPVEERALNHRSFFILKSMEECDKNGHDYVDVVAVVPMIVEKNLTK